MITFHYRQAGKLAQERGWAINIGGGFHHCSADRGGGFCAYADITLSIHFMFDRLQGISKVLIIDLDAHQVIMLIYYFTIKTMKVWVDMEKFCRDSTKLHFKEAVWIISCWIFFMIGLHSHVLVMWVSKFHVIGHTSKVVSST